MDVHPVFYRNTDTILPQSLSHSLSYFLFILNVSVSLYFCWTFLIVSFLCFKSSLVVNGPFNLRFLELLRKRLIQLNTLNVLRSENFDNSLSNMFSVVNVVTRISLIFFFSISDPRNFQLLVVVIVLDLGAIWDLPTIYYQAFIFHNLYSKIGWIFFRGNIFTCDKTTSLDFRHPITNKYFLFPVIF